MNLVLSPLAAAGLVMVYSALSMSADMMNMMSASLDEVSNRTPENIEAVLREHETPIDRANRFLGEIAEPMRLINEAMAAKEVSE